MAKLKTKKEKTIDEALALTELMDKLDPNIAVEQGTKQLFSTVNDVVVTNDDIMWLKEQNWNLWTEEEMTRLLLVLNKYMDTAGDGAGSRLLLTNIILTEIPVAISTGAVKPFPTQITIELIDWLSSTYEWFGKQWEHLQHREEFNIAEKVLTKQLNEGAGRLYLSTQFGWAEKSEKVVKAELDAKPGILNIDPLAE